ncbi:helix-turn-helix transcriptional regulator [Methylobacterium sp. D53M]
MDATDLSDRGVPPALLDDTGGDVRHSQELRSSQRNVKPDDAKIAQDSVCALRNNAPMATEPFSEEWFAANFARCEKTQAELVRYLAERGLNIDASKVSKMVAGRRKARQEEKLPIWEFFGYHSHQLWEALMLMHPDVSHQPDVLPVKEAFEQVAKERKEQREQESRHSPQLPMPNAGLPEKLPPAAGRMPILGKSVGGNNKDRLLFNGEALGYVDRPGNLTDKPRAYATYVHGESMEPRYEAGEIVLVNPDKGYRKGNYVVAQVYDNDGDPPFGYVKRFISFGDELVLEQLNPPDGEDRIMRFPRENVVAVHRIVGTLDE